MTCGRERACKRQCGCRSTPSRGLGPQYNRMRSRGHGLQAQPFEVSPALRIAGAGVRPHSLASLAGPFSDDSSGLDMWGVSLDESGAPPDTDRRSRLPPGDDTPPAAGAAGGGGRRLADRPMSSFSKYKMYYSGFDVGVTPPMAVAAMPRGSASSGGSAALSATPRPGEFANTVGQDWCAQRFKEKHAPTCMQTLTSLLTTTTPSSVLLS